MARGGQRKPTSLDSNRVVSAVVALPFNSQRAEAPEGAGAVGAGRVILQARGPVGDRCQHGVTMRNGFVAGQGHTATQVARRAHDHLGFALHAEITIAEGERAKSLRPASWREQWLRAKSPAEPLSGLG